MSRIPSINSCGRRGKCRNGCAGLVVDVVVLLIDVVVLLIVGGGVRKCPLTGFEKLPFRRLSM